MSMALQPQGAFIYCLGVSLMVPQTAEYLSEWSQIFKRLAYVC